MAEKRKADDTTSITDDANNNDKRVKHDSDGVAAPIVVPSTSDTKTSSTTNNSSPTSAAATASSSSPRAAAAASAASSSITLSTSIGAVIGSLNDISGPRQGICAAAASDRGKKQYQQDTQIIVDDLRTLAPPLEKINDTYSYYGIYDGHGGGHTSEWLAERLHLHFAKILSDILAPSTATSLPSSTAAKAVVLPDSKKPDDVMRYAIVEAFKVADQNILSMSEEKRSQDGSCAIVTIIVNRVVWIAHLGDCRAILARAKPNATDIKDALRTVRLTKDHSPLLIDERKRIERCGSKVENGRVAGILGVSRAFGDIKLKKSGVISQPDISRFALTVDDQFMVLACDGLFNVMTQESIVTFVAAAITTQLQYIRDHPIPHSDIKAKQRNEAALQTVARRVTKQLVEEAVISRGAKDNVTAVVLLFDHQHLI